MTTLPMNYVEPPDVPEGMTLSEFGRRHARPPRRRRLGLRRRVSTLQLALHR